MSDQDNSTQGEARIGKLIAAAGPGQTASPEAKKRVYAAVRAHWESTTAASPRVGGNRRAAKAGLGRIRRFRSLRPIGMAAAVVALAVSLSWLASKPGNVPIGTEVAQYTRVAGRTEIRRDDASSESSPSAEAAGAVLTGDTVLTGIDGRMELRRPDGLLLRMNVSTEVRFTRPDQLDLIAGTIYIDAGDGATSLEVNTPLGDIEHVGTQYELRLDDAFLRIRVREGEVEYSGATAAIATAGEQLEIDGTGTTERSAIAPNDPEWNWAIALATLPIADEYNLGETLGWAARELGVSLDYASPVARQRVAGQTLFGLEGLTPAEALAAIGQIADLQTELSGDRLVVSD